jgi:RNA polymerase sigma-70 factor (ECF subfamily)
VCGKTEGALVSGREKVAELYKLYGPAIYRRCLRLLGDKEAARDATQEVFGKLMRDVANLEGRDTALPWIYRVATNHCLNHRRNAGRRGEEPMPELEVAEQETAGGLDAVPERQIAQQLLSRFDEKTQAIAVGVFVDGMEHEEVAQALGISRRTVSRKLDRFLVNARKYLNRSDS